MTIDDGPNYLDVALEAATDRLESVVRRLREAERSNLLPKSESLLTDVCRAVRNVKFVFCAAKDSYGNKYEGSYLRLVDLAIEAAEIAARSPFQLQKDSTQRHANEIQLLQAEMMDDSGLLLKS